jgi:opacity protein-like surface antigen
MQVRRIPGSVLRVLCATFVLAPAASAQSTEWRDRAFLDVNVGMQLTDNPFEEHITPVIYSERGSITVPHAGNARWTTLDVGAGIRIWKSIGVGATYSKLSSAENVTVDALVPNPVLFNQTRAASKIAPTSRSETDVHIHALYVIPVSPRVDVMLSGGPSLVDFSQEFVTGLELSEGAAPFVTVAIGNVQTVTRTQWIGGFNAGAGVTYFLTELAGVGATIRYSSGRVAMQQGDGRAIDLPRGGLQVAFGGRLRFR